MPVAAMEDASCGLYGVQFHPEVRHTAYGQDILKNFLYKICDIAPTWTPVSIIEEAVERIQRPGGRASAWSAASPAASTRPWRRCSPTRRWATSSPASSWTTASCARARAQEVEDTFRRHFHVPLVHVQAQERFLTKLAGVSDPETEAQDHRRGVHPRLRGRGAQARQGATSWCRARSIPTSSSRAPETAAKIKSHHNVGGLPEDIDFDLVEPLRMLFKDEVRVVGEELGLPEQHRLAAAVPRARAWPSASSARSPRSGWTSCARPTPSSWRKSRKAGLYREIWQSFAVLPAIRSVGVMGDERTYAYPIVLRAVTSDDAMTADWARLPYDLLERISQRIINEVPGVNRVVLDISSKPPSTIEWE